MRLQVVLSEVIQHLGLSDCLEVQAKTNHVPASSMERRGIREGRFACKESEWPACKDWNLNLGALDSLRISYNRRRSSEELDSYPMPCGAACHVGGLPAEVVGEICVNGPGSELRAAVQSADRGVLKAVTSKECNVCDSIVQSVGHSSVDTCKDEHLSCCAENDRGAATQLVSDAATPAVFRGFVDEKGAAGNGKRTSAQAMKFPRLPVPSVDDECSIM
jgi:hypothetical protein